MAGTSLSEEGGLAGPGRLTVGAGEGRLLGGLTERNVPRKEAAFLLTENSETYVRVDVGETGTRWRSGWVFYDNDTSVKS